MIEVEIRWNGFYIGPMCFNELAMLLDITNYATLPYFTNSSL